jgi:hypothetical protein
VVWVYAVLQHLEPVAMARLRNAVWTRTTKIGRVASAPAPTSRRIMTQRFLTGKAPAYLHAGNLAMCQAVAFYMDAAPIALRQRTGGGGLAGPGDAVR